MTNWIFPSNVPTGISVMEGPLPVAAAEGPTGQRGAEDVVREQQTELAIGNGGFKKVRAVFNEP